MTDTFFDETALFPKAIAQAVLREKNQPEDIWFVDFCDRRKRWMFLNKPVSRKYLTSSKNREYAFTVINLWLDQFLSDKDSFKYANRHY